MTTPTGPAARALQRVRVRHVAGPDGLCVEDGKPWPCPTMHDADGDPPGDEVATLINRVRTAVTAAEINPPATVAALKRAMRDALGEPPPAPPTEPPPGGQGPNKADEPGRTR